MNQAPTQGFNQHELDFGDKKVRFCDLGGQRTLREYWQDYFEVTDCLMYVIDSADPKRLDETAQTFHSVVEECKNVPILVFANKQDLANALDPQGIAESLNLHDLRDRKWHIQGCSAKTGDGLGEGVGWILSAC